MTLRERDIRTMPEDIRAVGEQVLRRADPYRVIGEQLADLVSDGQFAGLYEPTGRRSVWPSVPALVSIFQFLEDLPDREAARQVAVRLDWKTVCTGRSGRAGRLLVPELRSAAAARARAASAAVRGDPGADAAAGVLAAAEQAADGRAGGDRGGS
jgi:hypothetical protein